MWDKLADVMETQARLIDDRVKKVAALQKLGILFTDKVNEPARATAAWRALLDVEPENKRGQDALKKLYLQQKNFDELEKFYAAQNKYDEYIRVLERQAETEDDATKVVLNVKIAELYRDRLQQGRSRHARLREGAVARRAEPGGGRGADPAVRGRPRTRASSSACSRSSSGTRKDAGARVERMRRLAELSEQQLKDKPAAYGWYLKLFGEDPRAVGARRRDRAAGARRPAAGPSWSARTRRRTASSAGDKLPLMLVVARV